MDICHEVETLIERIEGHNDVVTAILHALAGAILIGAEEEMALALHPWIEECEMKLRHLILKSN